MTATARYRYQTDRGNVFFARTDNDEELDVIRGPEPTTATQTENITFEFSKNAREVGCRPRHVILVRDINDDGQTQGLCVGQSARAYKKVIVLTESHFNSLTIGQSVTVDGQTYRLQARRAEEMR